MKQTCLFLLVFALLLVSCNQENSGQAETSPSEIFELSDQTAAAVFPPVSDAELTEDTIRAAYERAERTYALFTGFAQPEMGGEVIEVDGNRYQLVTEFADAEALRSYTLASFDRATAESLFGTQTSTGAPLYLDYDSKLYRFGGYRDLMDYDDLTITSFEFEESNEGDYRLTVGAELANGSSGAYTYHFVLGMNGIVFTDFTLMSELLMSSMKLAAPAYTEAAMLARFPESCGKPLFTHKIFNSRIYLFPVIEGNNFAVYCAEDYAYASPVEFKRASINLPAEYRYDSAAPLSIMGGGGSGECILFVRLTEKGANRYLALHAESSSAYDATGTFTGALTFDFAYECSLADVIATGYAPTEADLGAGLAFTVSSSTLNALVSNLTSPDLAGAPFEITFDDLPNAKLTGHLDDESGIPLADSIIVGEQALLFDEAPETLCGDFAFDLFRAEGVTVFDRLNGHIGDSYLFTDAGIIEFHESENNSDTALSFFSRRNTASLDGIEDPYEFYDLGFDLCYILQTKKYDNRFNEVGKETEGLRVLEVCTSPKELCYEIGCVTVDGGSLNFTPEAIYSIDSLYDLDALFERAHRLGYFTEYETVEALIARNAAQSAE